MSVSFKVDASGPTEKPSILLLTQNVGGIEACNERKAPMNKETEADGLLSRASTEDLWGASMTPGASIVGGSPLLTPESLSDTVKDQVVAFVAHLRRWLHRTAVLQQQRMSPHNASAVVSTEARSSSPRGLPAEDLLTTDLSLYTIKDVPPLLDVIVIHFQEIGGKSRHPKFNEFFSEELSRNLLPEAGWCSGLLMDAGSSGTVDAFYSTTARVKKDRGGDNAAFTALGSIIFLSPRMCPVTSVLSFPHRTYIPIADEPCSYGGTAKNVYHTAKFSAAGRSRKGFLLTSLRIGTSVLNTCNVHLFNDESNIEAMASSPSAYTHKRMEAFMEAVAECIGSTSKEDALAIFGDFNTRLDCKQLVEQLRDTHQVDVRPGRKSLSCPDSFWRFFFESEEGQAALRLRYDLEPRRLMEASAQQLGLELAEFPVRFAPTYSRQTVPHRPDAPLEPHDVVSAPSRDNFSKERVPAWCDRILWNPAALRVMTGAAPSPWGVGGGKCAAAPTYVYNAVTLPYTDHDGVFLLV